MCQNINSVVDTLLVTAELSKRLLEQSRVLKATAGLRRKLPAAAAAPRALMSDGNILFSLEPVFWAGVCAYLLLLLLNSVAFIRERTIPTERPPHVGEVCAKFCGL
jgi:hypothetical protein